MNNPDVSSGMNGTDFSSSMNSTDFGSGGEVSGGGLESAVNDSHCREMEVEGRRSFTLPRASAGERVPGRCWNGLFEGMLCTGACLCTL